MRAWLCSLVLPSLCGCGDAVPATVRGEGEEAPPATSSDELRESCATSLDEIEPAHDFGQAQNLDVTMESRARGLEDCGDYAWARGLVTTAALVSPGWAGPSFSASAWDCNHSSLEYGVYQRRASGWAFVGGAMAFGNLSDEGVCGYSVQNFPRQTGEDETVVVAAQDQAAAEVRVGVRAWSHNDTAMGHDGHDCESPSCYWPVRLRWRGLD